MSENVVKECVFWVESLMAGVIMAFAYDIIRLFRNLIHHNSLFVNIEDLLYWIMCFFMAFTMLYYENNGVIRLAVVFGAAALPRAASRFPEFHTPPMPRSRLRPMPASKSRKQFSH